MAMPSLPVPTEQELRTVLRRDWTMTLLALATMWFIVGLATILALWSAVTNGVPLADPQILLAFLTIAAVFWSIPAIATYTTYRRHGPYRPR